MQPHEDALHGSVEEGSGTRTCNRLKTQIFAGNSHIPIDMCVRCRGHRRGHAVHAYSTEIIDQPELRSELHKIAALLVERLLLNCTALSPLYRPRLIAELHLYHKI
jgi:hypothetical protein